MMRSVRQLLLHLHCSESSQGVREVRRHSIHAEVLDAHRVLIISVLRKEKKQKKTGRKKI